MRRRGRARRLGVFAAVVALLLCVLWAGADRAALVALRRRRSRDGQGRRLPGRAVRPRRRRQAVLARPPQPRPGRHAAGDAAAAPLRPLPALERVGALRRRAARADRAVSAVGLRSSRNRELGLLLLVAAVVAVGFTSVLVARSGVVSTLSLTYAGGVPGAPRDRPHGPAHRAAECRSGAAARGRACSSPSASSRSTGSIRRSRATRRSGSRSASAASSRCWRCSRTTARSSATATCSAWPRWARWRVTIASSYVTDTVVNGARVWIRVGGLSFQPGEFAKVGLVLFMAAFLREKRELLASRERRVLGIGLPQFKHLSPLALMGGGALALLVLMNDFGTSLLFFGVFLAMLYLATSRLDLRGRRAGRCSWSAPTSRTASCPMSPTASTSGCTPGRTSTAPAIRACRRCTRSPTAGRSAPASAAGTC